MGNRTNWQFFNPTELALKIISRRGKTVSKAEMHLRTTAGVDVNLTLLRPKLKSDIHSDLTELIGDLTEVGQVWCWREPHANGSIQCRIEITRENGERELIQCGDIEGLPA